MKIRYLGQNGFAIQFNGYNLVIDPFITGNPLATSKINIDVLQADYILLTHAHGDHIADAEIIAKINDAVILSNFEVATFYERKGIKTHSMNHGGKFDFEFGTVKMVNAIHSSSFPDGSYGGNPSGFVIWNNNECIYIAGDTALTLDMKLIPMTCPKLSVAILPIGDNYTMGYKDARIASDFIECNTIIGSHYNTFPVITIDELEATSYFEKYGKKLHLLDIGKAIEI